MTDRIIIKGLEVAAKLGVSEEERAAPQRLEIDLVLEADLRDLRDDIARTTDYAVVAEWVAKECRKCEYRLLESLAGHLAGGLLAAFPLVAGVEIEIHKFALPAATHSAVRIRRRRHGRPETR